MKNLREFVIELCRKVEIKKRLIIIYIFICAIPLLTISIYSYQRYKISTTKKLGKSTSEVLLLLTKTIEKELERFDYIGSQLVVHQLVQEALPIYKEMPELEMRELQIALNQFITDRVIISEMVQGVYILDNNGDIFYSMGYDVMDPQLLKKIARETDYSYPMEYNTAYEEEQGNNRLLFSRAIYAEDGSTIKKGYVVLVVDESAFRKNTYQDISNNDNSKIIIVDLKGNIISSSHELLLVGKKFPDADFINNLKTYQKNGNKIFQVKFKGSIQLIVYEYQPKTRWYLISMIPKSYINSEVSSINLGIIIICIFYMIVASLILSVVTASIDKPIKRLVAIASAVSKGNFIVPSEDLQKDEMAYLHQTFRNMVIQVNELYQKEQISNIKKRQLEIQMLQAQINPHFLFNTLNSFKWIAIMSRVQIIADGLDALAQLLRGVIIDTKELIPLSEELSYLEQYFFIQKLRYGDSFVVQYKIAEELKKNLMIKFILQPIVENSIIHGSRKDSGKIHISIYAKQQDDIMYLIIEDDGQGFDIETMDQNKTKDGKISGIGIHNVKERIEICFGQPYTMELSSSIGEGTIVKLILPEIKLEGVKNV